MRRIHLLFVLLAVASAQLLLVAQGQPGGEQRTALQVPAQFGTIQQAVDAAGPGDVIYVAPGTYCEQVVITKSNLQVRQRNAEQGVRPILSGDCATGGYGFRVAGTATAPVANVEISGFIVDGFETGILLENVVRSRVSSNEVRNNLERVGSVTPFPRNGVALRTASFNEISENFSHDNGHMGIAVSGGAGNIVRANRLLNNQRQSSLSCSLMLYAGATGNQVIDNLVKNTAVTTAGHGIMLGPGGALQNLVAGNRIVGHPRAGVHVQPASQSNLILQNDASGNGLSGLVPDLLDSNTPSTNLWIGNIGTCAPGNAGC